MASTPIKPFATSPYAKSARWLWIAPMGFLTLMLIVPTANIIARGSTVDGFVDVFSNPSVVRILWFTAWQSLASTVLCMLIALPATFVLSRYRFFGSRLLQAVLTVPFVLPTVVVGAAFLAVLPSRMHYTTSALLLAHAYFNLTVVVRIVGARWEQLHPGIEQAARTLGASSFSVLRTVTIPLMRHALSTAGAVVCLFSFTSYGIVRVLGGPARSTIETEIYSRSVMFGDMAGGLALGVAQMVFLSSATWLWARRNRHKAANNLISVERTKPRRIDQKFAVYGTALATATFVVAPIFALFWRSITQPTSGSLRFTLAGWREVASPTTISSIATTTQYAVCATVIATTLGLCVALGVAYGSRKYVWLENASALPLTVSSVTIGLGILITFDTAPFDFRSMWIITPLAHALIAIPIVVRIVLPVARQIPTGLHLASATLGARPMQTWLTIDRPLISRSLGAAAAISFATSIGEFGATSFLTRRGSETLPIAISRLLSRPGDLLRNQAYALCTIIVVVSVIAIFTVDLLRPAGKRN